jgi:hypothetical protein
VGSPLHFAEFEQIRQELLLAMNSWQPCGQASAETDLKQANLTGAMLDALNVAKVSALANPAPPSA